MSFFRKFILFSTIALFSLTNDVHTRKIRCDTPEDIPNGQFVLKRNNMLMRIRCRNGFKLFGSHIIDCISGKWSGQKPVCAKQGCYNETIARQNGYIQVEENYRAVLYCLDDYNLAGNRFAYCNGSHWDRELGICRERKSESAHECDFESVDICGWLYEQVEGYDWRRVTAVNIFTNLYTGPRHDHTVMSSYGGHYMLMESYKRELIPKSVSLVSPVYKQSLSLMTQTCFQFFYFMYGLGVGKLEVFVKPISVPLEQMTDKKNGKYLQFEKIGNQNNIWNKGFFFLDDMNEDFQIIFVATTGQSHLSDIAVDDVKLKFGENCSNESDKQFSYSTTTDMVLFETQSCVSHCGEKIKFEISQINGKFYANCSCHEECEEEKICCPDYFLVCLNAATDMVFEPTLLDFTEVSTKQNYYGDMEETTPNNINFRLTTDESYFQITDLTPKITETSINSKPTTILWDTKNLKTIVGINEIQTTKTILKTNQRMSTTASTTALTQSSTTPSITLSPLPTLTTTVNGINSETSLSAPTKQINPSIKTKNFTNVYFKPIALQPTTFKTEMIKTTEIIKFRTNQSENPSLITWKVEQSLEPHFSKPKIMKRILFLIVFLIITSITYNRYKFYIQQCILRTFKKVHRKNSTDKNLVTNVLTMETSIPNIRFRERNELNSFNSTIVRIFKREQSQRDDKATLLWEKNVTDNDCEDDRIDN